MLTERGVAKFDTDHLPTRVGLQVSMSQKSSSLLDISTLVSFGIVVWLEK